MTGDPPHIVRQRFSVPFEYPVIFTRDVLHPSNPALRDTLCARESSRRHRAMVVVDSGVAAAWADLPFALRRYFAAHDDAMELCGKPVIVPGGEVCKNRPSGVRSLLDRMAALGLDRQSFVLAIGGGAVLDMVGFAAATAHRGIRLVRLPTTVLAQNDAGIGVKNGINAYSSKNFLGAFAPPFAVVNDIRFIESLPRRDCIAGMAEAVKVALIRDAAFFRWMQDHAAELAALEPAAMAWMIRRCAELHLNHIATSGDPFEYGSARPLDFGHWAAHKLEVLTGHAVRHGEAVAIGIALDSRYAYEAGLLSAADLDAVCGLLEAVGLPTTHPALEAAGPGGRLVILDGLEEFRQHLGGRLTVTLLEGIGRGVEVNELREDLVQRAAGWLTSRRVAAA